MTPRTAVILSDYGAPYPGSFIPSMRALADELGARGWAVELGFSSGAASRDWLSQLRDEGRNVSIAPAVSGDELTSWISSRLEEATGPAVVHTHFTAFEMAGLAAARRRPQASVIWQVHTYLPRHPLGRVARQLLKYGWFSRRVDRVVCVGEATAHEIRLRGGARAVVIPNGIDVTRFPVIEPDERAQARTRLGVAGDVPVFVHFGWEWRGKGGPLFTEMLAELRNRGVEARGLAVGGGEPARAAAASLGLGDALVVCEPSQDVRGFYAAADALVATSMGEGGDPTFSILEALSCGIAVVGTDIPGHRVGPGGPSAARATAPDPSSLADAAQAVIERSEDQRAAEASEASAWVASERGLEGPARALADVYDELA